MSMSAVSGAGKGSRPSVLAGARLPGFDTRFVKRVGAWALFAAAIPLSPALTGSARAEPVLDYGADCARENVSAGQAPSTPDGIVLEGGSGRVLAQDIACADRAAAFQAFIQALHGPVGNVYKWSNGANRGVFRITWAFSDHGASCRDFAQDHVIGGRRHLRQGTACLAFDGNWHLR